jgi:hypothetical protein
LVTVTLFRRPVTDIAPDASLPVRSLRPIFQKENAMNLPRFFVALAATLGFVISHADAQTLTCASVSQIIFLDSATPQQIRADVPAGGTLVREDVYWRPLRSGEAWSHCNNLQNLQGTCDKIVLANARVQNDDFDQARTRIIDVVPNNSGPFFLMTATRLVVTYTKQAPDCFSQATFDVLPGSSNEFRLFVPPPARLETVRDWVRAVEADGPKPYKLCDDYLNSPSGKGKVNDCRSDYVFQFYPVAEPDQGDNAVGMRIVCSAKPDNNWVDKHRRCRAALVYNPQARPVPGLPKELMETMAQENKK